MSQKLKNSGFQAWKIKHIKTIVTFYFKYDNQSSPLKYKENDQLLITKYLNDYNMTKY